MSSTIAIILIFISVLGFSIYVKQFGEALLCGAAWIYFKIESAISFAYNKIFN